LKLKTLFKITDSKEIKRLDYVKILAYISRRQKPQTFFDIYFESKLYDKFINKNFFISLEK